MGRRAARARGVRACVHGAVEDGQLVGQTTCTLLTFFPCNMSTGRKESPAKIALKFFLTANYICEKNEEKRRKAAIRYEVAG